MIFTLFITCVLGLGAMQPQVAAPRTNETQVVESKKRNNLHVNDNYTCISFVELITRPETYTLFTDLFFQRDTAGQTYLINFLYPAKIVEWDDMLYGNLEYSYNNSTLLPSDLVFTLLGAGVRNSTRFQTWMVRLYNSNDEYYSYNFDIIYQYDSHNPTGNIRNIIGVCVLYDSPSTASLPIFIVAPNDSAWLQPFQNEYYRGYNDGKIYGQKSGYDLGYTEGYDQGEIHGKDIAQDTNSDIYQNTFNAGKQAGYTEGYTAASSDNGVPATIFSGILSVALIPVNVFIQMFQYEVFGINIAGLISALITIAMVIIIVRFLLGGKTDDK